MMRFLVPVIFVVLFGAYYILPGADQASSPILTISTFLFAIFAGFFIARQGTRYSEIRRQLSRFDGELTSIFRSFGHFGTELQTRAKQIVGRMPKKIIETGAWDYSFTRKTTTITDLHELLNETIGKTERSNLPDDKFLAAQNIITSLKELQLARKQLVSMHIERVPKFQWAILFLLSLILLGTLSTLPVDQLLWGAGLKAAFGTCVFLILILLWELDHLVFFESSVGRRSAQDVIDILEGEK